MRSCGRERQRAQESEEAPFLLYILFSIRFSVSLQRSERRDHMHVSASSISLCPRNKKPLWCHVIDGERSRVVDAFMYCMCTCLHMCYLYSLCVTLQARSLIFNEPPVNMMTLVLSSRRKAVSRAGTISY